MAIYALAIKHRAKGQGASAQAHAQYIAREGRYANRNEERAQSHAEYLAREGKHQGRARELEETWSGNMPAWAKTPAEFWAAADLYERQNGRVYTEVVIALPRELSREGRGEVVREFIEREIGDRFSYTVAIHNPKALDGGEQPHAHVMFSIRERDGIERPKEFYFRRANPNSPERGGAKKSREWSLDKRSNDRVNQIRATWEELANKALEQAGSKERIDRRTLEEQGVEREPEPKMGPGVTQRLKRGQETEIGQKVLELRNYRKQQEELKELEEELKQEKAKVYNFAEEREKRTGEGAEEFRFNGKKRQVSEEERQRYRRTVDLVLTRYKREDGNIEFRWKNSGKVAFVDRGDRISFNSTSMTAIKAGLQVVQEKGWGGAVASGPEEFRRDAWVMGQVMGIEVTGYEATKTDFERVEALKEEQAQKREEYRTRDREESRDGPGGKDTGTEFPRSKHSPGEKRDASGKGEGEWVKASDAVKELDSRIKEVRKEIAKAESEPNKELGGDGKAREITLRLELDSLYRDTHDLKQLADERIKVIRGRGGQLEIANKATIKKRLRQKGYEKGRERGPER